VQRHAFLTARQMLQRWSAPAWHHQLRLAGQLPGSLPDCFLSIRRPPAPASNPCKSHSE